MPPATALVGALVVLGARLVAGSPPPPPPPPASWLEWSNTTCPFGASCSAAASSISSSPGFWSLASASSPFYACTTVDHCPVIGNACGPNRQGPVCAACLDGFRLDLHDRCVPAGAGAIVPAPLLVSLCALTALLIVHTCLQLAADRHAIEATRSIVAFAQMASCLVAILAADLPGSFVDATASVALLIGAPLGAGQWFGAEWLSPYDDLYAQAALPLALALLSFVVLRARRHATALVESTLLFIGWLFHPFIVQVVGDAFLCRSFEGIGTFVARNPMVQCYTSSYWAHLGLGLGALSCWTVPMVAAAGRDARAESPSVLGWFECRSFVSMVEMLIKSMVILVPMLLPPALRASIVLVLIGGLIVFDLWTRPVGCHQQLARLSTQHLFGLLIIANVAVCRSDPAMSALVLYSWSLVVIALFANAITRRAPMHNGQERDKMQSSDDLVGRSGVTVSISDGRTVIADLVVHGPEGTMPKRASFATTIPRRSLSDINAN